MHYEEGAQHMSFNAGSIEATFDVDRTPLQQGLAAAKAEVRKFTDAKYKIKIDVEVNTAAAKAKVRDFVREESKREVKLKADVDTAGARRKIAELRRELARLRDEINNMPPIPNGGGGNGGGPGNGGPNGGGGARPNGGNGNDGYAGNPLLDAALILGPAAIPLVSGLSGLSSGLVGTLTNVALGVKGASEAMKEGTDVGVQYAGALGNVKATLDSLQRSASTALAPTASNVSAMLTQAMPELNAFIAQSAPATGKIIENGASALLNIFRAAEPLIVTAQNAIAGMVEDLNSWSQSSAASDFFDTLKDDIPIAVDALGSIVEAGADIVAAFAPIGHVMLEVVDGVTSFVDVLDRVPGLLSTIVTGLVAWRVAALATMGANKLLAATGLAASATGGPGGGPVPAPTGMRGVLAGGIKAIPYVIAASLGAQGLNQAINSDQLNGAPGSTNNLAQFGRGFSAGLSDLLSGNFSFSDSKKVASANDKADQIEYAQQSINKLMAQLQQSTLRTMPGTGTPYPARVPGGASYDPGIMYKDRPDDPFGYRGSREQRYQQQQQRQTASDVQMLNSQASPDSVASANDAVTKSIQSRVDAEKKLFDTSKGSIKLTEGLTVSYDEYSRVLKENNGDGAATIRFFQAHQAAMQSNQTTLKDLARQQTNYNDFLSTASTKYKLTSQEVAAYTAALGLSYKEISNSATDSEAAAALLGQVSEKFKNGNDAMQGWLATIKDVDPATATLADKANVLMAGLTALRGVTLSMAGTNLQAASSAESAANAIAKNSASIDRNGNLLGQLEKHGKTWMVTQPKLTEGALAAQQAMAGAGDAAVQLAGSIYRNTGSAKDAAAAYNGLRAQFVDTMVQSGRTRQAAENLANQIYGVPKDASTLVRLLGKNDVAGAIADLTQKLGDFGDIVATALAQLGGGAGAELNAIDYKVRSLDGKVVTVTIQEITRKTVIRGSNDPGAGRTSNNAAPIPTARGGIRYSYAVGGVNDDVANGHQPQVSMHQGPGMVRVWAEAETDGEAYIPFRNDSRRPHAKRVAEYAVDKLGGAVEWYARGGMPSLQTDDGSSSKSSGSGSGKGKSKKKTLSASDKKYNSALDDFIKALQGGFADLGDAATQTVPELQKNINALGTTLEKMRSKGLGSSKMLSTYAAETRDLMRLSKDRARITKELDGSTDIYGTQQKGLRDKYQDALSGYTNRRESVRDATLNNFDITTDGNGYGLGILATLKDRGGDAKKYESLLARAKNLGLNKTLIDQFEDAGAVKGGANLEAIVNGGKGLVSQINANYNPLEAAANRIGKNAAEDNYRKTLNDTGKKIRDDVKRFADDGVKMRKDIADIRKIVLRLGETVKSKKRT